MPSAAPARRIERLRETFDLPKTVDRDAGVIRGVKLLGRVSSNGRVYSDQALKDAVRLYEGIGVHLDHRRKGEDVGERSITSLIAGIQAPTLRDDGVYGDLHYIKSHPHADTFTEAAERMPSLFGMSHDAEGPVTRNGKTATVESLMRVFSVDIVRKPATVAGLFESEQKPAKEGRKRMAKITIEQILENAAQSEAPLVAVLEAAIKSGRIDKDLSVEATDDEAAQLAEAVAAGFAQTANLNQKGAEKSGADQKPAPDPRLEACVEWISEQKQEKLARKLLAEAGLATDENRLALLIEQDEKGMKALIGTWPKDKPQRTSSVRSASPIQEAQTSSLKLPPSGDSKAFAKFCGASPRRQPHGEMAKSA